MSARVVIACYRPKPGCGPALRSLVATHVPRLRALGLVTGRAPVVMEARDGTVVEVFEWASAEAIEKAHGHPDVQALWQEFGAVCDYVPLASVPEASGMFAELSPLA